MSAAGTTVQAVEIPIGEAVLEGDLILPEAAPAWCCSRMAAGSSRHSPRNRFIAETLNRSEMGTLLVDLLTPAEEEADRVTAEHRLDIDLLSRPLVAALGWVCRRPAASLPVGLLGASTGAAAALVAAAERPRAVAAVVSRGGSPDLAGSALRQVRAPTLLIVGGLDHLAL